MTFSGVSNPCYSSVVGRIHLIEGIFQRAAQASFRLGLADHLTLARQGIALAPTSRGAGKADGVFQNDADVLVACEKPEAMARPMDWILSA